MQINLSAPLNYKDTELHSLELDLENMTGYDLLSVEDDLRIQGVNIPAWEYSRTFLINIAAKSSHVPVEVLKGMKLADFTRVINEVLNFLAGQVSGNMTVSNSAD